MDTTDAAGVAPQADKVQEGDRGVAGVAPTENSGDAADDGGQEDGKEAAGVAPPEDDGGNADDEAQEGGMEAAGVAPPEDDRGAAGVAPPESDGGAAGGDAGPFAPLTPPGSTRQDRRPRNRGP